MSSLVNYTWSEGGENVAWRTQDFTRQVKREYDKNRLEWWFTQNYNNGRGVGSSWAVARGSSVAASSVFILSAMALAILDGTVPHDCGSQKTLKQRGMEVLASLKATVSEILLRQDMIPITVTTTIVHPEN